MIIEYSWLLYKKVLSFNRLFSLHYLLIIPGTVIVSYILFTKIDNSYGLNPLSYVIYFVFLTQTILVTGKRIKKRVLFLLEVLYDLSTWQIQDHMFYPDVWNT